MKITQTSLYARVVIVIINKKKNIVLILIKNVIIIIKKNISNLIVDSKIKNVLINLNQTKKKFKKFNKTSFTFNFYIELMNIRNFKTKRDCFHCYQKHIVFNCRFQNEKRFDE